MKTADCTQHGSWARALITIDQGIPADRSRVVAYAAVADDGLHAVCERKIAEYCSP